MATGKELADALVQQIAQNPTGNSTLQETIAFIRNHVLSSPEFQKFLEQPLPNTCFPICVLPFQVLQYLDSMKCESSPAAQHLPLLLSDYTCKKQNVKHTDLPSWLQLIPRIQTIFMGALDPLGNVEVVLENRQEYNRYHILLFQIDRQQESSILKVTIKMTQNLEQVYLASVHFVDIKRWIMERTRGKLVKRFTLAKRRVKRLDFVDI